MPDRRRPCGKDCLRCWRNKLKHGCPKAKPEIFGLEIHNTKVRTTDLDHPDECKMYKKSVLLDLAHQKKDERLAAKKEKHLKEDCFTPRIKFCLMEGPVMYFVVNADLIKAMGIGKTAAQVAHAAIAANNQMPKDAL